MVTVVFHRGQVAAVGLWAATCLGVVGATDGCTVGAVGACCATAVQLLWLMEW